MFTFFMDHMVLVYLINKPHVIGGWRWIETFMNIIKLATNSKEQVTCWPKIWPNW
jgi:hypothetical protein